MHRLKAKGIEAIICEPTLEAEFYYSKVVNDLTHCKQLSDVIVANSNSNNLPDVSDKEYSCDLFGKD
jgi:UDPglucose 6-dehydrogenase